MSIVRMKRLRLLALASEREKVLRLLAQLGAVELSETPREEEFFREIETDADELRQSLDTVLAAQDIAKKYGKLKRGLFSPRPEIGENKIFSPEIIVSALTAAEKINSYEAELSALGAEKARLSARLDAFAPWKKLDVPLDYEGGRFFEATLATVPNAVSAERLSEELKIASDCAEIFEVSSDRELRYLFIISHSEDAEAARGAIKQLGGAMVKFRGVGKTAREMMGELEKRISELERKIIEVKENIKIGPEQFELLLVAQDIIETRLACETESQKGAMTANSFYIEGWCPAREEKMLSEVFEKQGYAYEFADPAEGEEPPTLTHNSAFISPFNTITNMYSPPAYTGIDPNPTMAPFFAMFFGIMLSDAGYGLLLMLAGIFALRKMKPRGGFRNFMKLAIICGASTVLWGVLFGGFFGDAIPSVYLLFTGKTFPYDLALWFNPTNDPMTMLIFSLVLGGVQIVAGMAVKAYMMIRDGQLLDAIFDIGFWWVVFGGAITCIFNARIGLYVLAAGALGLILTQGRAKKNIIMKFFSGVLSLYDITGYFSDILSYSRLLALSLSTAVVGNVINTMGVITGPIGFILVFIIGHLFNIAINLVGSFVHSARLQYVEYFGKFYESGGRLFAPLSIKTKNTDIIKEEN